MVHVQDQRNVGEMIDECELHWHVQLPEGYAPDLQYMAHLWEPLRTIHHPLCLHLASEVAHMTCAALLRVQGFKLFRSQVCLRLQEASCPGRACTRCAPALLRAPVLFTP